MFLSLYIFILSELFLFFHRYIYIYIYISPGSFAYIYIYIYICIFFHLIYNYSAFGYGKILILDHQNNKQKLQILEALHIRNIQPRLNRINFQTSANDQGSILSWVIPNTQKWFSMPPYLTQYYYVHIKGKWSNPGKGVTSSPTPCCSSYWKRSLWAILDYGQTT